MSYIRSDLRSVNFGERVMRKRKADYEFALHPNWDGKGAVPLTPGVLKTSMTILQLYATGREPNDIYPGKDGSLALTWDDGAGNYIYCEIGPGDFMHVYYDTLRLGKWELSARINEPGLVERLNNALKHTEVAMRSFSMPTSSNYVPAFL